MIYEIDTVVRRPVSPTRIAAATLAVAALTILDGLSVLPRTALLIVGPLAAGIAGREALASVLTRRARLVASTDGLRIGQRLVPRDAFNGALLSHVDGRTYVALRGRENLDVQVPNNIEADALVRALGLDAASSTIEVALTQSPSARDWTLVAAIAVMTFLAVIFVPNANAKGAAAACGLALLVSAVWRGARVVLRVGADGLVVRRPLRRDWFIPHDAIAHVASEADAIVLSLVDGSRVVLRVGGLRTRQNPEQQRVLEESRADDAGAVVRRIQQAQRAFHEHSVDPGALAAALGRGRRTAREWLDDLRRIGEGAAGTFRTMGIERARLFEVVESTTASARDRIAAAIALRTKLSDDEKPRVRVAAERCAEPELRETMIRVVEAEDDELESLVEEISAKAGD